MLLLQLNSTSSSASSKYRSSSFPTTSSTSTFSPTTVQRPHHTESTGPIVKVVHALRLRSSGLTILGIIELTYNYGTEKDDNFKVSTGNSDPYKGFGHTCISVDNLQAACKRIEDAGYKFQKKLTDGRMKSIAFVLDPDGYWVEIIGQNPVDKTEGIKETDTDTYRMVSSSTQGNSVSQTKQLSRTTL